MLAQKHKGKEKFRGISWWEDNIKFELFVQKCFTPQSAIEERAM